MNNSIIRSNSIITNKPNLEELHTFKNFPVFIGCTDKDLSDDILEDMEIMICKDSGMIQLKTLLPMELVYQAYHSEAVGGIWKKHHIEFCKFCHKYNIYDVLEIGGSNGFIADYYKGNYSDVEWTIIDPTPSYIGEKNINIIKGFFNDDFKMNNVGSVVHSHTLEHLYDVHEGLRNISRIMNEGSLHIFTVPDLYKYLYNKYTNNINFEHTFFLTEYYIDYLLSVYGFKIIEKKYFFDHSIFYSTVKSIDQKNIDLINQYEKNKSLYLSFINHYKKEVKRLNRIIESHNGDIYVFGAHIFSQYLIHQGLNTKRIKKILDNSDLKIDKRLYGTNLIVSKPDIIKNKNNILIIVKAGQYQNEILKQLKELNEDVIIIE